MTRRELVARMGEDELREWLAFDELHPLPDPHWDAALVASTIARSMGAKRARLESYLPQKATAERPDGPIRVGAGVLDRIRAAKARTAKQQHGAD